MSNTALILDSITQLPADARGAIVLAASHAGTYSGTFAASARLGAVLLHDASFGRDEAGVAGLPILEKAGIPAAAVGHLSARIGDGADCLANGVVTAMNAFAALGGLKLGTFASHALETLARCPSRLSPVELPVPASEVRDVWKMAPFEAPILLVDSNSLVEADDQDSIVVTGSHGGLLGGRPGSAIKANVFVAAFNDAGVGKDNAGISRLPALDARGIAAVTVSASSARIGNARSTLEDGVVSYVNECARQLGAVGGQPMMEAVLRFAKAWAASGRNNRIRGETQWRRT